MDSLFTNEGKGLVRDEFWHLNKDHNQNKNIIAASLMWDVVSAAGPSSSMSVMAWSWTDMRVERVGQGMAFVVKQNLC